MYSQNLTGVIKDSAKNPIVGCIIFVQETKQGIVSNEDGYYQFRLFPGKYTIEFKHLGYIPQTHTISIEKDKDRKLDIVLEENTFNLNEIVFTQKEDPAYAIMRKTIEKAPTYIKATKSYKANAYIKGNGKFIKIPKLLDKMAGESDGLKLSDLNNQLFIQESFSEIEFTYPDKYKQTVKAFSSTIPDNMNPKESLSLMQSSIYSPKMDGLISPLNPNAFSYYRFRYEGFYEEKGQTINKIKITPKVKNQSLFDGYIYIADDTWHVESAELNANILGFKPQYKITYQQIEDNIYLPITYIVDIDVSFMGTEAKMNYYSTMEYTDIKKNDQISNLEVKKAKREFHLNKDDKYAITSDSLATQRDPSYWESIRTISLENDELISYQRKDSIQSKIDSLKSKRANSKFGLGSLLLGGNHSIGDSSKIKISYNGLLRAIPEYNFVDGLWIGQKLELQVKLPHNRSLKITPKVYYTLSRKRLVHETDLEFFYAPLKMGKLNISGGSTSKDFNPNGTNRIDNASSSLIAGQNHSFLYQKDYVRIDNIFEISNGLKSIARLEIAKRTGLQNNTSYTWGSRKKIKENPFAGDRFDKTSYSIGFQYTPYAYYTIYNGVKDYRRFDSPTFTLLYEEGFGGWQKSNSTYRKLRGTIGQSLKFSEFDYFNKFHYFVEGGVFLGNRNKIHFADYHHFEASDMMINTQDAFRSYLLLNSYKASTNKYWTSVNLNYSSQYLLIKRLPFLQGKLFTENIHFKNLHTPSIKSYTEVGYSIDLMHFFNAGVFTSFDKLKYDGIGFRLSINLDMLKRF